MPASRWHGGRCPKSLEGGNRSSHGGRLKKGLAYDRCSKSLRRRSQHLRTLYGRLPFSRRSIEHCARLGADWAAAAFDSRRPGRAHRAAERPESTRSGRSGARLGEKWSMLVVMLLRDGPRRFNDIKRNTGGISQQMLTRSLRGLERDGMLTRTIHPTIPLQVEYQRRKWGSCYPNRRLVSRYTSIWRK
jgi:DNA-binding HxlR family transcriptional regulator